MGSPLEHARFAQKRGPIVRPKETDKLCGLRRRDAGVSGKSARGNATRCFGRLA